MSPTNTATQPVVTSPQAHAIAILINLKREGFLEEFTLLQLVSATRMVLQRVDPELGSEMNGGLSDAIGEALSAFRRKGVLTQQGEMFRLGRNFIPEVQPPVRRQLSPEMFKRVEKETPRTKRAFIDF